MTTENLKAPKELNVGGGTNARKCGAAIRERMREGYTNIRLCAVGVSANTQAIKAVIELNKMLAGRSRVVVIPYMEDRQVRNQSEGIVTTVLIYRLIEQEI